MRLFGITGLGGELGIISWPVTNSTLSDTSILSEFITTQRLFPLLHFQSHGGLFYYTCVHC